MAMNSLTLCLALKSLTMFKQAGGSTTAHCSDHMAYSNLKLALPPLRH